MDEEGRVRKKGTKEERISRSIWSMLKYFHHSRDLERQNIDKF